MELSEIAKKLIFNGWEEKDLSDLPSNYLNEDVDVYLSYNNTHSIRFYMDKGFIRITIFDEYDERWFQINVKNNMDKILDKLIEKKDSIDISDYLSFYLELQAICDVSILAVEQFI